MAAVPKVRRQWLIIALAWILAALTALPVLGHWKANPPGAFCTHLAIDASYVAVALLCYAFFRTESKQLGRSRAIALVVLIFLLSSFVNHIHSFNVDHASNYAPPFSNEMLQEHLQNQVVNLSPSAIPHSYRFLPNAAVYWLQVGDVRFDVARDIYRRLAGLVLFYRCSASLVFTAIYSAESLLCS